jgi:protoheme IX farnesyltransferase
MKTATTVCPPAPVLLRSRIALYLELTKLRVNALVLFTVAAGIFAAAGGLPEWTILVHTLLGTALVAAGASALNQFFERDSDLLMARTENRPLPSGRLQPLEVLFFGIGLGVLGVFYLALTARYPLTALVAAVTFISYVFVYTPLKRKTTLNTLVGAVPGALPPVIGWTAVRGSFDFGALSLFAILFVWQVPHFLAIAWLYREDYARARLCMLPVFDQDGRMSARQILVYSAALVPISLMPLAFGRAGVIYFVGALLVGFSLFAFATAFWFARTNVRARGVVRISLVYLPVLLALLILDGISR